MKRVVIQTRLAGYLKAVKVGKLVNFSILVKELTKKSVPPSIIDEIFSAELVKPKKYRVRIRDEIAFNELCVRFDNGVVGSRQQAALYGDSHRIKVSGSYLLLRHIQQPQPVVVWFEGDQVHCPVVQSRAALLIENLENYIALNQVKALLDQCGIAADIHQLDIIYASGNRVTNKLHQPFFREYEQILCLFDVDVGALKMYQSLCQLLPDVELNFIYPQDVAARLAASERRMSSKERADLLNYQGISAELDQLIQWMRYSGTKLEQEAYLHIVE